MYNFLRRFLLHTFLNATQIFLPVSALSKTNPVEGTPSPQINLFKGSWLDVLSQHSIPGIIVYKYYFKSNVTLFVGGVRKYSQTFYYMLQ